MAALLVACDPAPVPPDTGPDPTVDGGISVPAAVAVSAIGGERLTERTGVFFRPLAALDPSVTRFTVDDSVEYQMIDGFGASFLEAGLVTLRTLETDVEEDAVLRAIFDPVDGAGFSLMKTVLGGTDFQSAHTEWFTYDDVPGDVGLDSFSIARDLEPTGVATFIHRSVAAGGDFRLQATMDFPPDWMLLEPWTNQNVNPVYYPVLAQYFLRYLAAYEAQGIHIDYLSPFNEPGHYTDIPMGDIHTFLRDHFAPALASSGSTSELTLGELSARDWAADEYPPLLDDPLLGPSIRAMGYHGYDFLEYPRIAELHARYPGVPLWQVEVCCMPGVPEYDFDDGAFWAGEVMSDLEAGAAGWLYWNLILDERGGPWLVDILHGNNDGNFQAAVVTINTVTHAVNYTGLYWYLAHFSRFVRPGAVRIETTPTRDANVRVMSFRAPDGSLVSVVLHTGDAARAVGLVAGELAARIELPAGSITTVRWPHAPL